MSSLAHRLAKLEAAQAQEAEPLQVWEALHLAFQRAQARARLQVCQHLGVEATDPHRRTAEALLVEDTPAQSAQDTETLARSEIRHEPPGAVGARLAERFEQIAQRSAAHRPPQE